MTSRNIIIDALNQIQEESFSEKELGLLNHPYYGLRDNRGWLTRYPKEGLAYSSEWVEAFIDNGGNFDHCGVWGVDPYTRDNNLSPAKAAEFLQLAHCNRWDNVPNNFGKFEVSENCSFENYVRLCRGQYLKTYLEKFGIETKASLFTLANKNSKWVDTQIAKNFKFSSESIQWIRRNYWELCEDGIVGNNAYYKCITDTRKFFHNREKKNQVRRGKFKVRTFRTLKHACNLDRYLDYVIELGGKLYDLPQRNHTTEGTIVSLKGKLIKVSEKNYGNKPFNMYKEFPVHETGKYRVALIGKTYFMWEKDRDFSSHIEGKSIQVCLSKLMDRQTKSEMKEKALKGCLSLASFRRLTGSCLAGTKTFLYVAAPFVYRLIQDFDSWDSLLKSDISLIEFQVTPEFMAKISHRF